MLLDSIVPLAIPTCMMGCFRLFKSFSYEINQPYMAKFRLGQNLENAYRKRFRGFQICRKSSYKGGHERRIMNYALPFRMNNR